MIRKIIIWSLFFVVMISSFGSPAIGVGSFTDKEYPSPLPTFNVANVILNLGATNITSVPAMGLIPGGYAEFKLNATNASTYTAKLNVSLDNFTVAAGTTPFAPKYTDTVIHTSNDLANATQIAVWIDTSGTASHTSPQPNDYSLTYAAGTATTTLVTSASSPTFFNMNLTNMYSVFWDFSSGIGSGNVMTMPSSSSYYTIHYNITLSGNPNNGIQGEQGTLGTSLTLHT
jgi:hypothetical protein